MSDPKYTGPHQSMRCTADTKIDDWYNHDETENRDVKCDDKTTFDAKYKHSSGYVRYKLYAGYPKVGDTVNMTLTDDSQARFTWRGITTTLEFKKKEFYKEVDFGTFHANNWFMNPYYRWQSETNFKNNSLALGWVLRHGDWMFRQQLRARDLRVNGDEGKVGDVEYEQKGKYVRDQFALEFYNKANITKRTSDMWKMLFSWANKDYGAALNLTGENTNMPVPTLYLRYSACDNTSLGCQYSYDKDQTDNQHAFSFGAKYVGDKNTTVRASADHNLASKLFVSHRLNDSCTMNFTFGHNLWSWTSDHKNTKGFLGYPWNYGLTFKLDG